MPRRAARRASAARSSSRRFRRLGPVTRARSSRTIAAFTNTPVLGNDIRTSPLSPLEFQPDEAHTDQARQPIPRLARERRWRVESESQFRRVDSQQPDTSPADDERVAIDDAAHRRTTRSV